MKYNGDRMFIYAEKTFFNKLGGTCGKFNGDRKDDKTTRQGSVANNNAEFLKSWVVS